MSNHSSQKRAQVITVIATFLAFMGIGIVDPILPVIAEQIGATHWQVEMLFTAYIFTMAFMMLPSGLMASKYGDKRLMMTGMAIVTLFALLCGLSDTIAALSWFRAGWGLGNSMFFATAMTLLIALTPDPKKAVGLYEAAIGLGMACGPLVGGLLGSMSWRLPFIGTSILIFIAFLLVILFIYEPSKGKSRKSATLRDLKQLMSYAPFARTALAAMCYYYGFFVVLAYTPLVLGLSAIGIGLVFFGWGLCLAYGSAVLSHQLENKYQPKTLLPISLTLFFVIMLGLSFVHIDWLQIVLIIVSGLFSGLNNALFTSYSLEVSPYERSMTSGAYNFVRWFGAGVAPVASGLISQQISPHAPFLIASVVLVVSFIFIVMPEKAPQTSHAEVQRH